VLCAIGLSARLAPFLDQGGRLLWQFPTEDGYLMLTIARNIALGNGMSTAAGTIPTNGTQPLATYLFAACFWLVDGARRSGVMLVLAVELLIAVAAALLLYLLGRRVFATRPEADSTAALAAALWFASPLGVVHTMNCLESGLYVLCILVVSLAVLAPTPRVQARPSLRRWSLIGLWLGVAFWARNDAVLLCAAVGLAHLANLLPAWRGPLPGRLAELFVAAAVTVLVAAPWLVQNLLCFGSIVPVSGQAQSLHVELGQSLADVPASLAEHLTLVGLIPSALETHPAVVGACTLLLLGVSAVACVRAPAWSVFPVTPFLALLLAGSIFAVWRRSAGLQRLRHAVALAAIALLATLNVRTYLRGSEHGHSQVVDWVQEHVAPEVWVAAVQTGTLGFFHDHTINLDGKVNPEALRAREQGRIPVYVLEKDVDYIVDWADVAPWADRPDFRPHFELLVRDEARNLAVLRRRRSS
jgi:hypothetical protein